MRFTFELEVPTLLEAAEIEEVLKNNRISYKLSVEGNNIINRKAPKRKKHIKQPSVKAKKQTRARLVMADVERVEKCIKKHPSWNDARVSKTTKISGASVYRIRTGQHRLQIHPKLL